MPVEKSSRKRYNIDNLQSVSTFAKNNNVTPGRIYQLISDELLIPVIIDEVLFIDRILYPILPNKSNTKPLKHPHADR